VGKRKARTKLPHCTHERYHQFISKKQKANRRGDQPSPNGQVKKSGTSHGQGVECGVGRYLGREVEVEIGRRGEGEG